MRFVLLCGLVGALLIAGCSGNEPKTDAVDRVEDAPADYDGRNLVASIASKDECPIHPDVCALAAEVDDPLRIFQENLIEPGAPDTLSPSELSGIFSILRPVDIECTYSGGLVDSLCGGVRSNQKRLGIWVWNDPNSDIRSAWTMTRVERELLFRSPRPGETGDEFGAPELRLVAIGCPPMNDLGLCREDFSFVFSSRATYPHDDQARRFVFILPVHWPQDSAPASRLIIPIVPFPLEPTAKYSYILGGLHTCAGATCSKVPSFTQEPNWLSGKSETSTGVFFSWRP